MSDPYERFTIVGDRAMACRHGRSARALRWSKIGKRLIVVCWACIQEVIR